MRAFLVVDLGEVVLDEENKFPWAINWFRRSDSAVGKFFIVLFTIVYVISDYGALYSAVLYIRTCKHYAVF